MEKVIIKIAPEDKRQLRKIYADFMNVQMYDENGRLQTLKSIREEQKRIVDNYFLSFTDLADKGCTITHLPEHIFNKNQLRFINDCNDNYFQVRFLEIDTEIYPAVIVDSIYELTTNTICETIIRNNFIYQYAK